MIKGKKSLEETLSKEFEKVIIDQEKCNKIYEYANAQYDIPKGMISDFISMRTAISEASEFVLFILLDSIEKAEEKHKSTIDTYFTMQETQQYRKSKYEIETIKFPLSYRMIQVTDDQWIGHITVKELMQLRAAQLINYNANAQRTMQKIIKGDKEVYKITLNQKSVNEIANSMRSNSFIPNPLTLNIPQDESDFYYDEDTCTLTIKSLDHFDITDGYHRYISACQVSDENPEFDYPMEFRIINFSDDKAKQFIFQEDQKTKMKKVDSASYNMNKSANIVATRLNENIRCNLKGLINRNDGIISFPELADLVNYFYFKEHGSKSNENALIIKTVNELMEDFNALTEFDTKYIEKPYDYRTLLTVMYVFNTYREKDKLYMCELIEKSVELVKKSDSKKFQTKTPRKALINEVEKIVKGVE